jgi:hypothetical protein
MDLLTILDTLSREIIKHEDRTDGVNDDVASRGSMVADEVAFHLTEGLFNDDLKARLKLAQKITGYDLGAFLRRYPDTFSSAILDD